MLGILFGGIAGYYGGWVDNVDPARDRGASARFPELPLWMALSAALPVTWSPLFIYFGITIILGAARLDRARARGALEAARAARGGFLRPPRELMGAKPRRIIGRHLLPSFMSHLIASATLSIPA